MDQKQKGILNALVTYAAEHIPGGLSDDEHEVAQIVGSWATGHARRTHNYKIINPTVYGDSTEYVCNLFAEMGWRVVAVISDNRPSYADAIILERPVGMSHPDD